MHSATASHFCGVTFRLSCYTQPTDIQQQVLKAVISGQLKEAKRYNMCIFVIWYSVEWPNK